ncbi:MAG: cob(I)yrinic acid a,c-diamide adenosyltransferase [Myxococcales bacterium FL481]|nr:MAG: cob(I)yrinic acid a,c-diamide adenosyltransferase [Myxococcales bacterium FL481]
MAQPSESSLSNADHRDKMRAWKDEQDAKVRARQIRRGVVIVNEGDGKGKSTAAFGMAIRAAGHGQRVGIVQFIKGTWKTGERAALSRFSEIDLVVAGDGFTWNTQNREQDIASARRGLTRAIEMVERSRGESPRYDLVVLDELNIAVGYGYLPVPEVVELLRNKPRELSIVVTGRGAKPEIIEVADTVTRMVAVKHAFEAGIRARKGVDF